MKGHRLFSSASSMSVRQRGRLLDAARGLLGHGNSETSTTQPLPCFALKAQHLQDDLIGATPGEFHARLVALIRNAQRRVCLASLYIGPAVNHYQQQQQQQQQDHQHPREFELLQALEQIPSHVDVQIVMDRNRGLRQIPSGKTSTTSSAQAVANAIHLQANHQLYLCQVLPDPLDAILPNPLNEVAGVFHIKAYIVDDTLILSGANLSEEYFSDRHDRYFQIQGHGPLVDFYAKLIDILCREASDPYEAKQNQQYQPEHEKRHRKKNKERQALFWKKIQELFADQSPSSAEVLLDDPETMAVCIPTFHHPQQKQPSPSSYASNGLNDKNHVPSDVDCTVNLLWAAGTAFADVVAGDSSPSNNNNATATIITSPTTATTTTATTTTTVQVQLSSAYLNPPPGLLRALSNDGFSEVDFLTAGPLSHGFRPKPSASGNKGKAWIPTVFDHLQSQALEAFHQNGNQRKTTLWHWQRPDWTFHAKGLWITTTTTTANPMATPSPEEESSSSSTASDASTSELVAAIVGSSNFGRRSWERDMESNLILVFPPKRHGSALLAARFFDEWKQLVHHSDQVKDPQKALLGASSLPWHVRVCYPFIQSFF